MSLPRFRSTLIALVAATVLAGCAGRALPGGGVIPQTAVSQQRSVDATQATHPDLGATAAAETDDASTDALLPDIGPPACKGQTKTKKYASDAETLSTKGGKLCIPAFKGLGGTITYPPANPSVGITLTTSTTNYTGSLPSLGTGKPVVYIQVAIAGSTTFGSNAPAGGGLAGKQLVVGNVYTVYGQATVFGFTVNFTPCYGTAVASKYGGELGGIGTLLKGVSVPAAASGVLEVYPGKNASGAC